MSYWASKYIGLKYEVGGRSRSGVDCWGLLRLVYQEELGITLPMLPGIAKCSSLAICREIKERVRENWIETEEPEDMCAVGMGTGKNSPLLHVGVWASVDGGKVIHSFEGGRVVAETIWQLKLRGIRTIKFFIYGVHHRDSEPVRAL